MAVIALEGMEFFAFHGLYPEEQERGNTFVVDVWLDLGNAVLSDSDEISDVLDYAQVYGVVAEVMQVRVNLLETLVVRIGKELEDKLGGWEMARVRVSKMNPPVDGTIARSYVEETFRAEK